MKYTKLENIQNQYPDGIPVSNSYSKSGSSIRYTGKYSKNFREFNIESIANITVADTGTKFPIGFIVDFGDGDYWTSVEFRNDLQEAVQDGNPYFKLSDVTIVRVNFNELSTYWTNKEKFRDKEDFANVVISKSLTTKDDIFRHIAWMVSNPDVGDELRPLSDFGKYTVNTSSN